MVETIRAKLEYTIFENESNHYAVASFVDTNSYSRFTATGQIIEPQEEQEYELIGEYITHPKYGKQFKIEQAKKILPTQKEAIIHFLSSDSFPTIGKKSAELIYDTWGDSCLEKIYENPDILHELPRFPHKKIEIIQKGIHEFAGFSSTFLELMRYGLTNKQISRLEDTYENVLEVLKEDPFTPYYEVYGFGYKSAEKIANFLELSKSDHRRIDAYIYETLRRFVMRSGSTYILYSHLYHQIKLLSELSFDETIQRLIEKRVLVVEEDRIYPRSLYEDEVSIAQRIHEHDFNVENIEEERIEEKIEEVEFAYAIDYDPTQKKAIHTFFQNSIMILNGGPGTGKTTIVKGILFILKTLFPTAHVQLCAPTGRASKRLSQLSDTDSKTIHSLLQWNLEENTFNKNEKDPLDLDFLIVDEFSMVDTHVFAQLLKALPPRCRILLIGDENQLESVGPGKVFNDLIESNQFPIVHLNKVFRQSDGSGIALLAKSIREETVCQYNEGVRFLETNTNRILSEITQWLETYDIYEKEKLQIIAPMYKGIVGIDAINQSIQQLLNPASALKRELRVGTTTFREGDKVMLLKNMPDEDVYNGDIGWIVEIVNGVITVDFKDQIVDFDKDILYYLTHAYCISVHKSQGNEYERVFCIVDPSAHLLLNKRLLYTGISRAKKELLLIGSKAVFEDRIHKKENQNRRTTLKKRILANKDLFAFEI